MESDPKTYRATFAEPTLDSELRVAMTAADGTRVSCSLPIIVRDDGPRDASEPVWVPLGPDGAPRSTDG